MGAGTRIKKAAMSKVVDYIFDDPVNHVPKLINMIDKANPNLFTPAQRKDVTEALETKNGRYQLLEKMGTLNTDVIKNMGKMIAADANLEWWPLQEELREKYQCNIPWAVLCDPTSACNLHCTGCWSADFGSKLNLTYDDLDDLIMQSKELGIHVFIYTGGEPLVRKTDLMKLCEKHSDCLFLCFTNGTLIDDKFCQDLVHVANFIPSISVEGFREATDSRRGQGTFDKVVHAMELLRNYGLPFGVSCCYTSENADDIGSEEFFNWLSDQGALFAWLFMYMPIGHSAPTNLMPTAEQRKHMYYLIRKVRVEKPIMAIDFWNDGEFIGGCIAGGRRYLHINANGDVEPCVFAHYSNVNIHEGTLLEALQSPLFMEYYRRQPFNWNLLRPCPILDNDGVLSDMVVASHAKSTNPLDDEPAKDLCEKCHDSIMAWAPIAEELWEDPDDDRYAERHSINGGMAESDMKKLHALGRDEQYENDEKQEKIAS